MPCTILQLTRFSSRAGVYKAWSAWKIALFNRSIASFSCIKPWTTLKFNFRPNELFYHLNQISGIINTDLHRHMYKTWYGWLCWPIHKFFVKTPFYGAQTTLYCCLSDSIQNGGYYSDCRQKVPSQKSMDDRACKKLWDMSEKMVGLRSSQSEML